MPALNCIDCTDIVPGGTYTCLEQKFFGKCSALWMREGGYCMETCGFCSKCAAEGQLDDAAAPLNSPISPSFILPDEDGSDCSCTDVQPPGPYTCNEQITCGRCNCMNSTENELIIPTLPIAEDCSCTDVIPPGKKISCREQRSYGKCEADWMLDTAFHPEGYCQTTCGRCLCSTNEASIDPPASAAPPPSFVPPLRIPSPQPEKLPTRLPPDPLGRSSFPILSVSPPQLQMPVIYEVVTTTNHVSMGENKPRGTHAIVMRNPNHTPLVVVIENPLDAPQDPQNEVPESRPFTRSSVVSRVPVIVVPIEGIPSRQPQDSRDGGIPASLEVLESIEEATSPVVEPAEESKIDSEVGGGVADALSLIDNLQPLDELEKAWTAGPLIEPSLEPYEDEELSFGLVIDTLNSYPNAEPDNEVKTSLETIDVQLGAHDLEPPIADDSEDIGIDIDMSPSIEPLDESDTDFLFLGMEDITPVHEPDADAPREDIVARETDNGILSEPSLEPLSDQDIISRLVEGFEPAEEPTTEAQTLEDVDAIEFLMEPSIEPTADDFYHEVADQLGEDNRVPSDEKVGEFDDEVIDMELGVSIVPSLEDLEDQEYLSPELEGDLDLAEEQHEPYLEDISDIEQDLDMNGVFLFGPSVGPIVEPHAEPLDTDIEETSQAQLNREKKYDFEPTTELEDDSMKDNSDKSMIEPISETNAIGDEHDRDSILGPAEESFGSILPFQEVDEQWEIEFTGAMAPFEEASPEPTEEPTVPAVEPLDEESNIVPADQNDDFDPPKEIEMSLDQKLPSRDNCTGTGALLKARKDLSIFGRMIRAAGLMDKEGNLQFKGTLLAPNNRAVQRFLSANGLNLDELLRQDILLKALISFFVIDEVLYLGDLYNGMQVKPRVTGAEPLIILRTDLTLRGRLESIIVIVGARETARIVGSGLVSCDVAVHIIDRFLPPSVTAPMLPSPEAAPSEELKSESATALTIPPKPEEELIPADIDNPSANINTPSPQMGTEPGLSMSLLEGILDYEDDPANNQSVIAEKMLSGKTGNLEPQESNRGE